MNKMFPTQKDKRIQTSSLKCFYCAICTIFTRHKKMHELYRQQTLFLQPLLALYGYVGWG